MKEGIKKRKSDEMAGVNIAESMISLKISRGNEYLFKKLEHEVNRLGIKSRNRLIENILVGYFEDIEKQEQKMKIAEYHNKMKQQ